LTLIGKRIPSDVRDAINVSDADIPDVKVQKMVKRAEVTLELGREPPQLADYVFALRSKLDHVSRYKTARRG
jgi:hypothetical protein